MLRVAGGVVKCPEVKLKTMTGEKSLPVSSKGTFYRLDILSFEHSTSFRKIRISLAMVNFVAVA